jgi:4-hydroxybenzoate polyprenyltransferase
LGLYFNGALIAAAGLFCYQHVLLQQRRTDAYFKAFLHNNWVGMVIFVGMALDYLMRGH